MENKIKIVTIVGTRPEIIRLSRVLPLLDQYADHVLVHTGQNYDFELNEIFFNELELRKPDVLMNVDNSSFAASIGDIIKKTEIILKKERPDALLVLGDTNSCLSAYVAKRLNIPIFHMEAGNRCFDFNVPEEINRRIIDHISDFNLVYTEHARRHLIAEGIQQRRIYLTGSPLYEVLTYYHDKIEKSLILSKLALEKNKYFLVSSHREENVDNMENLSKICSILNRAMELYGFPIIVSTHPRTRKRLEELKGLIINPKIHFSKPFGFFEYVHLQKNAACTISDSGTISEESAILSFPAVSLRESMERPEAQDAGTIILTGLNERIVLQAIEACMKEHEKPVEKEIPPEYLVKNTSWRVLKLIIGNSGLSNKWHGINK